MFQIMDPVWLSHLSTKIRNSRNFFKRNFLRYCCLHEPILKLYHTFKRFFILLVIKVWEATNSKRQLPTINSVISVTLCRLLHSVIISDTPIKSYNFHEMSSIHSFAEAKKHSPAPWVSFSLSVAELVTKVFCLFVGLMFKSSEC